MSATSPPTVDPSSLSCGVETRSSVSLPAGAKLWSFGTRVVFEGNGGIITSDLTAIPQFKFSNASEQIVEILDASQKKFLVITRIPRGISVYEWDDTNPAAPKFTSLLSKELTYTDLYGRKVTTPLVDLVSDGTVVYLLGEFHLLTTNLSELAKGQFNPQVQALPECKHGGTVCERAVGIYWLDSDLWIPQMPRRGGSVRMSLAYNAVTQKWKSGSFVLNTGAPVYTNILKYGNVSSGFSGRALATSDSTAHLHLLWGSAQGSKIDTGLTYIKAASFQDDGDFSKTQGVLAFHKAITLFYRAGIPVCKVFETMSSVLIEKKNTNPVVHGIDANGFHVTVNVIK